MRRWEPSVQARLGLATCQDRKKNDVVVKNNKIIIIAVVYCINWPSRATKERETSLVTVGRKCPLSSVLGKAV